MDLANPPLFHLTGSHFAPKITYVSVIGNSIQGKSQKENIPFFGNSTTNSTLEGFAFESYHMVCGDGNKTGDGVVPCCADYLEDAIQITLEGI